MRASEERKIRRQEGVGGETTGSDYHSSSGIMPTRFECFRRAHC